MSSAWDKQLLAFWIPLCRATATHDLGTHCRSHEICQFVVFFFFSTPLNAFIFCLSFSSNVNLTSNTKFGPNIHEESNKLVRNNINIYTAKCHRNYIVWHPKLLNRNCWTIVAHFYGWIPHLVAPFPPPQAMIQLKMQALCHGNLTTKRSNFHRMTSRRWLSWHWSVHQTRARVQSSTSLSIDE